MTAGLMLWRSCRWGDPILQHEQGYTLRCFVSKSYATSPGLRGCCQVTPRSRALGRQKCQLLGLPDPPNTPTHRLHLGKRILIESGINRHRRLTQLQ